MSASNSKVTPLRPAGYNERRYITRQSLGYYRTLAIGGIYTVDQASATVISQQTFIPVLKHCVATHPLLSATIKGQDTESPSFARPKTLDLHNHVEILCTDDLGSGAADLSEKDLIHRVTNRTLDFEFSDVEITPPWKIVVFLLPSQDGAQRLFVLFAYYHSHGDGKSALAFHKTILQGLNQESNVGDNFLCETPSVPLPPTIEQAGKLSIPWSYLLSPLFGAYLPEAVVKSLGLRASTTPKSADAWTGKRYWTRIFSVPHQTMDAALRLCRAHDVKFTGLLHQLIVRALSEALPGSPTIGGFVASTVVDLCPLLNGIGPNDMSCPGPTAAFELFSRSKPTDWNNWTQPQSGSPIWTAARRTTKDVAKCATTLHDQPIGLLSYLSKFRPWMQGEAEKYRDTSYEISNLGVFDPTAGSQKGAWDVESMFFAQPANFLGGCLAFSVVTRKGGDMTVSVTWQERTLGVEEEQAFVARTCQLITQYLGEIA
ncbi:hypothetical protein D6D19_08054 [Aureobasidium pullulans]|uniref:Alcohol acetyltransferase n=1 Tax=Aureobasidium pullulans TaxID=5580 RepID=A0A4S9LEJ8_AURPU|nr:hypothetical protein D6D19_08054 [Aureobasidium pullulans]THY27215.1 hypothetical protein D6D00_05069 [Aureobasidium pullulans]